MPRRTKIIATLGPALEDEAVLLKTLKAGVDVFRANFSHGKLEEHARKIEMIRKLSQSIGKEVAIFADLQGPKIRIARFQKGAVVLKEGQSFAFDIALSGDEGDERRVGIDYKELIQDVKAGDELSLDDGRILMTVLEVKSPQIICRVDVGGKLSNHKGINKKGGGLSAKALTDKDKTDLKAAVALGVDYIAVSFVRSAEDMEEARRLVEEAGGTAGLISKIERVEALDHLDEIIRASDAVMVARGDLAIEIGDAEVPAQQKHIIQRARVLDKVAITATQMMESMIENSVPTRAEISDVANAVLDGTDAVMLSAETAVGKHPYLVVEAMSRACLAAEKHPMASQSRHRVECYFQRVDEAIAMATMYVANHLNIRAIVALTESGSTPLWMSRIRTGIPIYALTRHLASARKMTLFRGVFPVIFDPLQDSGAELDVRAVESLKSLGLVSMLDLVIVTKGDHVGEHGGTNMLRIHRVE